MMNSKKLILAGLPMIAVTYGLSRFSYGLLSPYISNTLHISSTLNGLIASLSYLAYCFAIIFTIYASNHLSSRFLILFSDTLSIVGLLLILTASNALYLGTGIFVCGLSAGIVSPPYSEIVDRTILYNKRNQTNSWINSGTSIGITIGGIISILLGANWRIVYLIFTTIAIIIFIINYFILPGVTSESWKDKTLSSLFYYPKKSLILGASALLVGISSSAYWTFSRTFLLTLNNIPGYIQNWLWPIIGISGLFGGCAGWIINKNGLNFAYIFSILLLTTASLVLGIYPNNMLIGLISPVLFGFSYIFMSSVLLIWGVRTFKTFPALGIGLPFLTLALGQTIGTVVSGMIADAFGFYVLFFSASIIGYLSLFINPKFLNNKS